MQANRVDDIHHSGGWQRQDNSVANRNVSRFRMRPPVHDEDPRGQQTRPVSTPVSFVVHGCARPSASESSESARVAIAEVSRYSA